MSEATPAKKYNLLTVPSDIKKAAEELGRDAPGAALLQSVISPEHLAALQAEVAGISITEYEDVHRTVGNKRNVPVTENYWQYGLDRPRGDEAEQQELPHLRHLAKSVQNLVQWDLGEHFQRLKRWDVNDSDIQYYDRAEGLSYHYDHSRYWGAVAIATLEGESEFLVRKYDRLSALFCVAAGDIVIMRGSNLLTPDDDAADLPEHSVQNVALGGRKAFVMRSNSDKL
jgi:alkylated DNA repair dioxygenase AlkB